MTQICNHKLTPKGWSRSLCPFIKIFTIFIYGKKMTLFIYLFILHHMPMEEN